MGRAAIHVLKHSLHKTAKVKFFPLILLYELNERDSPLIKTY